VFGPAKWTRRRRVQLADLVNEPWVLRPPDTLTGALAAQVFRASGLEPPRATVFTQSINMHNSLLTTGRFLAILPSFSLRLPGAHPALKALPLEFAGHPATERDHHVEEPHAEPARAAVP
jgi:DNA-binding transcriptional LysR family regulator